jgi:mannose-6-phosphate isomerase-like protein (cupin superfamily)
MSQKFLLFGTHLTIVTDEKETDSRYDLIDGILQPGTETPPHLHTKYSEDIYVLEGELTVYIDDQALVLHPGERCFIPIGKPHVVASTGTTPSRALTIAAPSGFAKLIRSVGTPGDLTVENPNVMELFMRFSEEIGDVILGPPGTRPF